MLVLLGTGDSQPLFALQERMPVAVDAVSVRGPGISSRTQVDLYTQISYRTLRFKSGPLGFTARYKVSAEVSALDDRGRPTFIVQSPIWDRSVTVPVFAQTESAAQRDITTHSLLLEPGPYLIAFQITDLGTGDTQFRELTVEVPDLSGPLAISDLMLVELYDQESKTFAPRVSSVLSQDVAAFEVFFELYTDAPRAVTLISELSPVQRDAGGKRAAATLPAAAPVFLDTVAVEAVGGRHQMVSQFPMSDLQVGRYRAQIRAQDGSNVRISEREVVSQWSGLSVYLDNLDEAIEQMVYVASRKELQELQREPSAAARRQLFNEFWKKRDPTPQTERNERMEEYYYRVNLATRRFSSVRPGWQTDRGHVFILHGNPEDTQRQTFSFNAEPYEVWYYYRIGRQYVFVDATGFGDFELLVPIWDERTRIR